MDFEKMNLFAAVEHTDDNKDLEPDLMDMSEQQMMDYMVMAITRELKTAKAFKGGYVLNQLLCDDSRMTHVVNFSEMMRNFLRLRIFLSWIEIFCIIG